jgi:dynein heavy chain
MGLSSLPHFGEFYEYFKLNSELFKPLYDATELPAKLLPDEWNNRLSEFQKIVALKALRPDLVVQAITKWVSLKMGQQYIMVQTLSIANCFADSSYHTPLIFILSPGSDPVKDFMAFAEEKQ